MVRRLESLLMLRMSVSVKMDWAIPPPALEERRITLFAIKDVLQSYDQRMLPVPCCIRCLLESPLSLPSPRALVYPHQLNPVPGLTSIHQIIPQDHLHTSRQLSRRCSFWHFLNIDRLEILESGKTVFHRDGITVTVIARDNGCRGSRGVESLSGDGGRVVVVSGVETVGGLTVVDGLEHLRSYQRTCRASR